MDMQKKVQIVSDGSLDLSQEITKEHDIEVVPFYVSFDSETYQKEMVELGVRDFYNEMVEYPDVFPKSSMPSVDDFYQVFEKVRKSRFRLSAFVLPANSAVHCSRQLSQRK